MGTEAYLACIPTEASQSQACLQVRNIPSFYPGLLASLCVGRHGLSAAASYGHNYINIHVNK